MRFKRAFPFIAVVVFFNPVLLVRAEPTYEYTQLQCTDILGQQRQNDAESSYQNDAGSQQNSENESHQQGQSTNWNIQGGAKFLGIGANFGYGTGESSNEANASGNSAGRSWNDGYGSSRDQGTITTGVVGRNCDSMNQFGAARDISRMNYELQRRRDSTSLFHSIVGR